MLLVLARHVNFAAVGRALTTHRHLLISNSDNFNSSSMLNKLTTALLLIDVQQAFDEPELGTT